MAEILHHLGVLYSAIYAELLRSKPTEANLKIAGTELLCFPTPSKKRGSLSTNSCCAWSNSNACMGRGMPLWAPLMWSGASYIVLMAWKEAMLMDQYINSLKDKGFNKSFFIVHGPSFYYFVFYKTLSFLKLFGNTTK